MVKSKSVCLLIIALLIVSPYRSWSEEGASPAPPAPPQDLSLNFQNTDIDVVLKFFSDITGKIFIKSDQVRGSITVVAPGRVTLNEAMQILQSVLDVKGFTMIPTQGKMVKVLSQAEAAQTELEIGFGSNEISGADGDRMMTQVIPLKYIAAADMKAQLASLSSKGGSILTDERVNTLIITDMSSNIRRLMKMITALDIRTPQVLIEALIMEVTLTEETKLGFEWSQKSGFPYDGYRYLEDLSQDFDIGSAITEGLTYSIIRNDMNVKGLVKALATDQDVNILSTPHIMTLNNQPALIRVGEEVPILTQTRNVEGGDTIRSFDYKSVAIELEVTPRITSEREVFLKVHPTVKKILGFNAELNAPILASREAQTSVIIKDGQTVVIGGLMKDDRSVNQSKIPILGDIPLIGAFFRSRGKLNEKTELLVFITPRVVLTPEEARALTVAKEGETKLTKKTPNRTTAVGYYHSAKDHYSKKRYEEALSEAQLAIELTPDKKLRRKAEKLSAKARKKLNR